MQVTEHDGTLSLYIYIYIYIFSRYIERYIELIWTLAMEAKEKLSSSKVLRLSQCDLLEYIDAWKVAVPEGALEMEMRALLVRKMTGPMTNAAAPLVVPCVTTKVTRQPFTQSKVARLSQKELLEQLSVCEVPISSEMLDIVPRNALSKFCFFYLAQRARRRTGLAASLSE